MCQFSRGQLCWLVFVNLTQTRGIWEEGTFIEGFPPSDGLWPCCEAFPYLVIDAGGSSWLVLLTQIRDILEEGTSVEGV